MSIDDSTNRRSAQRFQRPGAVAKALGLTKCHYGNRRLRPRFRTGAAKSARTELVGTSSELGSESCIERLALDLLAEANVAADEAEPGRVQNTELNARAELAEGSDPVGLHVEALID